MPPAAIEHPKHTQTNGAWNVYVRVMLEDDLDIGATYLVSAEPPDANGVRMPGDMASFNPHMRIERQASQQPPNSNGVFTEDLFVLRIAFESYSTNLDDSISDDNVARDIYYTELVVPTPVSP